MHPTLIYRWGGALLREWVEMEVLQCQLSVPSLFLWAIQLCSQICMLPSTVFLNGGFISILGLSPSMRSSLPTPLCQDNSQPHWHQQQKWPHIFPDAWGWAGAGAGSVTALRMFACRGPWENCHPHITIYIVFLSISKSVYPREVLIWKILFLLLHF